MKVKREIRRKLNGLTMRTTMFILAFAGLNLCSNAQDVVWKKNFGGKYDDAYSSVITVSDGFVAVGNSDWKEWQNSTYFSYSDHGDWAFVFSYGKVDAVIVKYNNAGNVVWKKNFSGSSNDYYTSVTALSDGIVAVGYSAFFGSGDWSGITGNGGNDAIIVKYDNVGDVIWKKNFGGSNGDYYYSVTTVLDGIVAVGYSDGGSFGTGDWEGTTRKGSEEYTYDAIIVKYDFNGDVVWKKNFGGEEYDEYHSVIAVLDGVIVVGKSNSFGSGDWENITGNGWDDAMIVKYDNAGNVVWQKNFGGSGQDAYSSVTSVSDGIIVVGYSEFFGSGDWTGVIGKGDNDAIIVKYDNSGNVLWKKNFGGVDGDYYNSVAATSDGIVAVGYSYENSFSNGDWTGMTLKGGSDAIIVKYDNTGNVLWKKNLGGNGWDEYSSVTTTTDGIITVGNSSFNSFGNGDWLGISGKGDDDAIIVKYTSTSTGIARANNYSPLRMYPNPNNGIFTVDNGNLPVTIKLYNMLGQEILTQTANGKTEININHLPQGVYNVRIFSEGKVVENSKITKY